MKLSKKGSMQLSINAIVVIVLALTMLGLGLSFIKGQVSQMTQTSTGVQQQIAEQIEGQLRASGEKMSFPRELTMERNEQKVITLGVQNVYNTQLCYTIDIEVDGTNSDPTLYEDLTEEGSRSIRYDEGDLYLGLSEAATTGISVKAPSSSGIAALRATITDCDGDTYASKLAFLTVV